MNKVFSALLIHFLILGQYSNKCRKKRLKSQSSQLQYLYFFYIKRKNSIYICSKFLFAYMLIGCLCLGNFKQVNQQILFFRLLYWQIAETVNCRLNQSTPQDIRILCSRILSEAKNIAYNHYPEMMRDLFIEQSKSKYMQYLSTKKI